MVVSPTYFGACADVAGAGRGRPRARRAAGRRRGLGRPPALPPRPAPRRARRAAPTSSSPRPTRSSAASPRRRCSTSARAGGSTSAIVDRCVSLVESTSPSAPALRLARRRPPPGLRARRGLLAETMAALAATRERIRAIPGLDVLDERMVGQAGRRRLGPAAARRSTSAAPARPATGWRSSPREHERRSTSSSPPRTSSSRSSASASAPRLTGERLVDGAARRGRRLGDARAGQPTSRSRRRRPGASWR